MASQGVLLHCDHDHISSHIQEDQGVEHMIRRRGTKIKQPHQRLVHFLQRAGFYSASFLRGYKIVPGLITALVERWRPETHTFHFPFGECTITLEDVAVQLGIPTNGKPLVGHNKYKAYDICMQYLGKAPLEECVDGLRIRMSWLQQEFSVNDEYGPQELECAARAYILQLIGGVLMPDTSGNMVHTQYLLFMADLDTIAAYSWGSAVLAFLYHEMCKVTIMHGARHNSDMGGCQLLLQSWAWYRLPYLTPILSEPIHMEFPLAGRWRHKLRNAGVVHNTVRETRLKIQTIGKDQFIWQPYMHETIRNCLPAFVLECAGFWGAVVPLIHFSIVEFHCADRVLRQFNFHQPIPSAPRDPIHTSRRGRYNENWIIRQSNAIEMWEERWTWWAEGLSAIQASDFQFDTEYYAWFSTNGKPFIASVEDANQWLEDPRCSRRSCLPTEFGQSSQQSTEEPNLEEISGWPTTWSQSESPSIYESSNPWEQEPFVHVSEQTPYQGSCQTFGFGHVPQQSPFEQNFATGGTSSSQPACNDGEGYVPQFQYPEEMYATPPTMQVTAQEFFDDDEVTPDNRDRPQRDVHPAPRYSQTSSLHRQVLRRRRRK